MNIMNAFNSKCWTSVGTLIQPSPICSTCLLRGFTLYFTNPHTCWPNAGWWLNTLSSNSLLYLLRRVSQCFFFNFQLLRMMLDPDINFKLYATALTSIILLISPLEPLSAFCSWLLTEANCFSKWSLWRLNSRIASSSCNRLRIKSISSTYLWNSVC